MKNNLHCELYFIKCENCLIETKKYCNEFDPKHEINLNKGIFSESKTKCNVCKKENCLNLYKEKSSKAKLIKQKNKIKLTEEQLKSFKKHSTKETKPQKIKNETKKLYKTEKREKIKKQKHIYKKEFKIARIKVLERDNNKCVKCGSCKYLHVHHIVKKSKGGSNEENNLITLCKFCHKKEHEHENVSKIM